MDQQWQYTDASASGNNGRPPRFSHSYSLPQHHQQQQAPTLDLSGVQLPSHPHPQQQQQQHSQQPQLPQGFKYETAAYAPPSSATSKTMSMSSSPATTPHSRDANGDGDIAMEDADPYNRAKYTTRPSHQRASSQYLAEESSAARKYSPMNALSPALPYQASPTKGHSSSNSMSYVPSNAARQSPSRANKYVSPPSGSFTSPTSTRHNPLQLPPLQSPEGGEQFFPRNATAQLNAAFAHEGKSPRHAHPPNFGLQPTPNIQAAPGSGPLPRFHRVKSTSELQPKINMQPAHRRANPEGGFISPLQALTTHLPSTYRICNPAFKYESSRNPRRVLTKPSKGTKNDGYDNEDSDYILYVNDILGSETTNHKNRYLILDVLGQGTFGQVVKCQNLKTQEVVAVKVVKNRTAYFNQSMMEVSVLDLLNSKLDKNDDHHLLRLKDTFIHRQHLCLVFELLSVNLYELIKQNQFRGLSTTLVRVFAQQLLNGLSLLNKARLIHCDLKPENILLKNLESPIIKIIDFGSACDERQTVYTYIQSRFYRCPEVLLGLPYSSAIDMWSLGCIVVELFLGLPLFPGSSEYNQVSRITEMLGLPPMWMLEMGKQSGEFFEKTHDEFGRRSYRLKTMEQYAREHNTNEQPSKKYFQATTLPEIIRSYSMPRKNMKQAEIDRELNNRVAFIDFVRGLLNINPLERWSPQQAKLHPFITQQKFTQPFVPPMNLKTSSVNKTPAPGVQQQQQAEAASKHRAQAQAQAAQQAHSQMQAQAQLQAQQAQMQAQSQAQSAYAMQMNHQYSQQAAQQQSTNPYNTPFQSQPQQQPPPYPTGAYNQMNLIPQTTSSSGSAQPSAQPAPYPGSIVPQQHAAAAAAGGPQSLYAQATTRAGRQRASTMEHQQGGIPAAIQRVASHLDPNAPIRLQPSPAYYPPPPDGYVDGTGGSGSQRRRGSRVAGNMGGNGGGGGGAGGGNGARGNRDFIRNLEDGAMGDGFMGGQQWQ